MSSYLPMKRAGSWFQVKSCNSLPKNLSCWHACGVAECQLQCIWKRKVELLPLQSTARSMVPTILFKFCIMDLDIMKRCRYTMIDNPLLNCEYITLEWETERVPFKNCRLLILWVRSFVPSRFLSDYLMTEGQGLYLPLWFYTQTVFLVIIDHDRNWFNYLGEFARIVSCLPSQVRII